MENKITFKNRISSTPNRRKLKIINQTADEILADIEMADNPTEEGTAINAEILNNIQDVAYEALNQVTNKQGSVVYENGDPVNTFDGDKKLNVDQGLTNASKVMITDSSGKIIASDNMQFNNCKIYQGTDNNGESSYIIEFLDSGKKVYINQTTYNRIGLPIGTIFQSTIKIDDSTVHILDGAIISQTGIYAEFATFLKQKVTEGKVATCDNATFENEVSLYGNCGKFVIDDTNNTIRLPKITRFVQGLSDITCIGQSINAGLPNITGFAGFSYLSNENAWNSPTGALSSSFRSTRDKHAGAGSSQTEYGANIHFDASKSTVVSNIYGNSNTVQPQATQYPYYIVLANSINTNLQVNIDNVANDISLQNNNIEKLEYDSWEYVSKYLLTQQTYEWALMYDFDFDSYDYELDGVIGVNHSSNICFGPIDSNANHLSVGVRWGAIRLKSSNNKDVNSTISGYTVIQDSLTNPIWLSDGAKNEAHFVINVKLHQDEMDNGRVFFETRVHSVYYGEQEVWLNQGMIYGTPLSSKQIKGLRLCSNSSTTAACTVENSYLILRRRRKR